MSAKKYVCRVCEHYYDPEEGEPGRGVRPGTSFNDLPDEWECPGCGAPKREFERVND